MSYPWFVRFWNWAQAEVSSGRIAYPLHFHVGSAWHVWWSSVTTEDERAGVRASLAAGGPEAFAGWLAKGHFNNTEESLLILSALLGETPFSDFPKLRSACEPLVTTLGIGLEDPGHHSCGHPLEVTVVAVPKGNPPVDAGPVLWPPGVVVNPEAVDRAYRSVGWLLSVWGLLLSIPFWALLGWDRLRGVLVALWCVDAAILFLAPDLAGKHLPGSALGLILGAHLALVGGLGLGALIGLGLEWKCVLAARSQLLGKQLLLLISAPNRPGALRVEGLSLGTAIAVQILYALFASEASVEGASTTWEPFRRRLRKESRAWCFIGALNGWGLLPPSDPSKQAVLEIDADKFEVIRALPDLADVVAPPSPTWNALQWAPECLRVIVSPKRARQGLGKTRFHPCWHLAEVVLVVGGQIRSWRVCLNLAMLFAVMTALAAGREVYSLLLLSSPRLLQAVPQSPDPQRTTAEWVNLTFDAPNQAGYRVRFVSDYWADVTPTSPGDPAAPGYHPLMNPGRPPAHAAEVHIYLRRKPGTASDRHPSGRLEVWRFGTLLGRPLPSYLVSHEPYPAR